MVHCLIGLGSNLGDSEAAVHAAWQHIGAMPGTRALRLSRIFATEPAGGPGGQGVFSNAVGLIETGLPAETLLRELLTAETSLGRVREQRWGPRAIDLDLLLYGDTVQQTPSLTLPHPRMAFRRFVLEPAADIAPELIYPRNGWSIGRLLDHLDSTAPVIAVDSSDESLLEASLRQIAARCSDVDILHESFTRLTKPAETDRWQLLGNWPQEELSEAHPTASRPKLVVILAPPNAKNAMAENRKQRLLQRISESDVGPSLWLETDDANVVADEVIAAMTAMR